MKKMKMMMLASALVSMTGLNSCLDGGEYDPTGGGLEFVRVNSFMGITTLNNQFDYQLVPSSSQFTESLDPSKFAYTYYTYDTSVPVTDDKRISVDLQWIYSVPDGTVENHAPTVDDANAPVAYAAPTDGSMNNAYYKANNIFLPIGFFTIPGMDADESKEELDKHSFKLCYDPATDFNSTTMTLHLRHTVSDIDDAEVNKKRTQVMWSFTHFDITRPLADYRKAYGEDGCPDDIVIKYEENGYSVTYPESGNIQEGSYTLISTLPSGGGYKTFVEYYEKYMNPGEGNDGTATE